MPVSIVTLALAVRLSNHSNLQKKEKDKDLDTVQNWKFKKYGRDFLIHTWSFYK